MCDPWVPQYYVEGRRVEPGRLYRLRDGGWAEPSPRRCPNGHLLGAGRVLAGTVACPRVGGFHRTHICRTCEAVIYTPARLPECRHDRMVPAEVWEANSAAADEVLEDPPSP
ncbi:hypothetical protein OG225_43390 (plasmid) [Nocardia sp. NBC_01377]|uniref:hypothetical protein n=1 Tax=Nocardia sp. NBC_01377 TaxID=2903595 RepID=UPI002F90A186